MGYKQDERRGWRLGNWTAVTSRLLCLQFGDLVHCKVGLCDWFPLGYTHLSSHTLEIKGGRKGAFFRLVATSCEGCKPREMVQSFSLFSLLILSFTMTLSAAVKFQRDCYWLWQSVEAQEVCILCHSPPLLCTCPIGHLLLPKYSRLGSHYLYMAVSLSFSYPLIYHFLSGDFIAHSNQKRSSVIPCHITLSLTIALIAIRYFYIYLFILCIAPKYMFHKNWTYLLTCW